MSVTRILIVLLPALAVAAGNWFVLGMMVPAAACPSCAAWFVGAPIVLALALLAIFSRLAVAPPLEPAVVTVAPAPDEAPALLLLARLQEEGRLVDFLEEDLTPYPDEQIGAAARGIHDGCRKVLQEHVTIEPVVRAHEGETVTLESGFDPGSIRLTGNVGTNPPFRGVVRHTGWRVARATLPARGSEDPHILAPAEVEIP